MEQIDLCKISGFWILNLDFTDFCGQNFFFWPTNPFDPKYIFVCECFQPMEEKNNHKKLGVWNQKLALSVCLRMLFKISITAVGQAVKFD